MSTQLLRPYCAVTLGSESAAAIEGPVTIDSSWSPYAQSTVVLHLDDFEAAIDIDPRTPLRATLAPTVTGAFAVNGAGDTVWVPDAGRRFDLGVRSRRVQFEDRTVTLELASDEALLQDYAPLVDDTGPWSLASSLRSVCNYVLSKVIPGATLNAFFSDSFEDGVGPWSTNSADATFRVGTSSARSGNQTLVVFTTTAGGSYQVRRLVTGLVVGRSYTLVAYAQAATNPVTGVAVAVDGIGAGSSRTVSKDDGYVMLTKGFTATSTQHNIRVQGTTSGSGTANALRWDDVAIIDNTMPTDDADVTPVWELTQLFPNPAVRSIVGNWIAGGSNGNLSRETGWAAGSIPAAADLTTATLTTFSGNSGNGQGGAFGQTATLVPYVPVTPGKTYTVYCWALSAQVAKQVKLSCQIFGADGQLLQTGVKLATVNLPVNTWTLVKGTIEIPAVGARLGPFVYADDGVQWANGNTLRTTAWMAHEGVYPTTITWFDGATPADSKYTYEVLGPAHASATTRKPKQPGIDPDSLIWSAGTTAWDFLEALVTAAGLRLFCDELRVWRLVKPDYTVDGSVVLTAGNATAGDDLISREDAQVWAQGVVVRYTWTDADGISRTKDDTAGAAGKVLLVEYRDTPYPGPGAAAAILAAMTARGRVQGVTSLTDYRATPGMQSRASMPGSGQVVGTVRSVQFDTATGLMQVASKGQQEIPADSWAGAADTTWADVADSVTWATYTP